MSATVNDSSQCGNAIHTNISSYPFQIVEVSGKGLGLVSASEIPVFAPIMSCAAKPIDPGDAEIPSRMSQFLFVDPERYSDVRRFRAYLMVCGEMVFLNHCDTPNCRIEWFRNLQDVLFARLVACTSIAYGDELTIQYTDRADYNFIDNSREEELSC